MPSISCFILVVLLVFITGCSSDALQPGQSGTVSTGRFTVQSQGEFHCARSDRENYRSIYIVTDTITGVSYLAIQGCGTSQLITEQHGKITTTLER